jgi:membrane complex biogenesis BtpA family protein
MKVPPFAAARRPPWLIGVVHLKPLPGSPRFEGSLDAVLEAAIDDLRALVNGGADGAILENYGDAPFHADRVPPVTIAAMTAATVLLRAHITEGFLLGVNVLRNDAAAAMSIASVIGASFIRVNIHVGVALTDQGTIAGRADETLRLRASLGRPVWILADAGVKHARSVAYGSAAAEAADAVERGLADAILVTGARTGMPVDAGALASVRRAIPGTPLLAASGVEPDLAQKLARHCDGFIVGTWLKREGKIEEPVDLERVRTLSSLLRRMRA